MSDEPDYYDDGDALLAGRGAENWRPPDPDPDSCPVRPLGWIRGLIVFGMPEGEIRIEPARQIASALRTDIFADEAGERFLNQFIDPDGVFARDALAKWLVRACRNAGRWNDSRERRSLGVWPAAGGGVVLHVGDAITEDAGGSFVPIADAFKRRDGPLYLVGEPQRRPAETPATTAEGYWLRNVLGRWSFDDPGDGLEGVDVAIGWIGLAILGAVAPFRTHLLATGLQGSGKTTLASFVHAALSSVSGDLQTGFTEAGFRNGLANEARPIVLDETEARADGPGAVEGMLDLIRRMSTGTGGTHRRGEIGGGSTMQRMVGAVWLGAITPPKLLPADTTRIVGLRLQPLPPSAAEGGDERISRALVEAKAKSPALVARALRDAERYLGDFAALKAALGRAGEQPRGADLIASLAGGRRLLLFDTPLTAAEADAEVRFWRPLIERRAAIDVNPNEGELALAHLMNFDTGYLIANRRQTVGELVQRIVAGEDQSDPLRPFGVRVEQVRDGPDSRWWLWVANAHPGLERVFGLTRWKDWRGALEYLTGLGEDHAPRPSKNSYRFGVGVKSRFLAIPLAPWIDGERRKAGRDDAVPPVPPHVPGNSHEK